MTRDEFEALAKKAGLAKHGLGWTAWESQLERFAELVAAHEREACAATGRKFIGIERERRYFDLSCERIARAHAQGTLLDFSEQPQQTMLEMP